MEVMKKMNFVVSVLLRKLKSINDLNGVGFFLLRTLTARSGEYVFKSQRIIETRNRILEPNHCARTAVNRFRDTLETGLL